MDSLLSRVKEPSDLHQFSFQELKQLAKEIRERIIQVLSINGGHLASNLGSVEMILALHYVFQSPKDKFVFDVSHQTYPHKLLTGRNDQRFDRIRKHQGLSGFAHPFESEHDHFFAGHAGTALSLALGMAKARDLLQKDDYVIPIIGDATLTCGLSLEALNNIRKDLRRFIVVLNDNAMSISRNVGGITNILSRLMSNPTTNKWVHELEHLVGKIPVCGTTLAKQGQKITESLKNLVSSAPFFEHFGLSYIGPVDGHDLKKLILLFEAVKELHMPVIVHLYTQKGHGVTQAENDPITYHGVKPFNPITCEFIPSPSKKSSFPKIFGKHMVNMAKRDPYLVAVTPAMSLGSCLDPLMDQFPDRCIDVGIAEGHAVTFAGGIAKDRKLKVVCSIYSTFLQRALDNLFQDVCLQQIPVIFAIDRAGLATGDGATHHGIYEIGFLKTMPNMVICQPRDGQLLQELLESSFGWNTPVAIRYPNMETEEGNLPLKIRPLGKGEVIQEGEDLLILAVGHTVSLAHKVCSLLSEKGISAAIVDPIFIKPLDTDLLCKFLLTHSSVVTIEEHSLKGGFGAEISQFLASQGFNQVQLMSFGIPEAFYEHGDYEQILEEMGMSPEKIAQTIVAQFTFSSDQVSEKQFTHTPSFTSRDRFFSDIRNPFSKELESRESLEITVLEEKE
jgi:1-deoxy-D-xylulose-5-phosphate synthase